MKVADETTSNIHYPPHPPASAASFEFNIRNHPRHRRDQSEDTGKPTGKIKRTKIRPQESERNILKRGKSSGA